MRRLEKGWLHGSSTSGAAITSAGRPITAFNPRPWKSVCDGHRVITMEEASQPFRAGIVKGMFSNLSANGIPKYVWSVDADGEVYEAKIGNSGYHGYRLEDEDDFRAFVLEQWKQRCAAS
jgi:hypothetical protein